MFLDYLEFFKTLLGIYNSDFNQNCIQIESIIDDRCLKLGYEFKYDSDKKIYRVMLKNSLVESVALEVVETTKNKLYSYLTIRSGDIDSKRSAIKSLYDDVEVYCKKYKSIPECDKLKQFVQCTRHTKDKTNESFPFYYEDEEKWLDKTFEMIVGILAFKKTKEIVSEIKKLEKTERG